MLKAGGLQHGLKLIHLYLSTGRRSVHSLARPEYCNIARTGFGSQRGRAASILGLCAAGNGGKLRWKRTVRESV
jgi:hypothetical protein